MHQTTFSIGYRFYYWNYYKHEETRHDHHYEKHKLLSRSNLYISKKYNSLKDEILYNKYDPMDATRFNVSMAKAKSYLHTKWVKSYVTECDDYLHYGIEEGSSLTICHLLAIIFYTHRTSLSTAFSATFRRTNFYESIDSMKQRNSEFATWSRLLREVVEYWGSMTWDDNHDKQWNNNHNRIKGPFFCGVGVEMVLPEYNIRLCSPTSTSKSIHVAQRFGGEFGVILQINNVHSADIRSFGCKWISNHANEEEYLFCGGKYNLKIDNIWTKKGNLSYQKYLRPLYYFDCILNGGRIKIDNDLKLGNDDSFVMMQLIHHKLNPKLNTNKLPKYINDSFNAYIANKHQIILNIDRLEKYFKIFSSLLCVPIDELKFLNLEVLNLFENLKHLEIIANKKKNAIDLLSVLASIKDFDVFTKNNVTIDITSMHKGKIGVRSWLFDQYRIIIDTHIARYFNLKLKTKTIARKYQTLEWDMLTITTITDTWNCPICNYNLELSMISCSMCGYSFEKEMMGRNHEKLDLYQQIWFVHGHDKLLDNDELHEWELHNQHEIEQQIMKQDDDKNDYWKNDTPMIDFQRQKSAMDIYLNDIDDAFIDGVLDEVEEMR